MKYNFPKVTTCYFILRNGEWVCKSNIFEDKEDAHAFMAEHPNCVIISFGPGYVGLKRDEVGGEVFSYCCH